MRPHGPLGLGDPWALVGLGDPWALGTPGPWGPLGPWALGAMGPMGPVYYMYGAWTLGSGLWTLANIIWLLIYNRKLIVHLGTPGCKKFRRGYFWRPAGSKNQVWGEILTKNR